ncbi:carbohydrate ABC transporter permease [Breznakiella homolactica]|uniref:Carbohydrate ABC transporter permease n=1 Tax=Breznakiella homolactica TaxID=2798577 RepID=A0A7T7XNA1_9SPIR|nr:carbohydrate ABC transporter permease [Breznakiella homolactica]QQO09382.1 carbohydrate ABC transporter permease [Breznakiella homolactica]
MITPLQKAAIRKTVITVIMFGLAILFIFPFLWMISTSFKFEIDVMEFPFRLIPKNVNTANYTKVWTESNFPRYYLNSIFVTTVTVFGDLILTSMAAYAFARLRFRGKNILFALYISAMMIPGQVLLLPKYILFGWLGINNTHAALILPGIFSIFSIFLLRQFFMTIPYDLTEAATIDGAGHFRTFLQIILPLAKPGLTTLILISSIWSWNDYINPLIFLSNDRLFTLTVGLQRFQESNGTNYAIIMSGAVCAILPVILLFIAFQKQFVQSIASAGIKG